MAELTGYATIDKPWEQWYKGIVEKNLFENTTPYIGLLQNNKNHTNDIAIEYFGARIRFSELFRQIDDVANSLASFGVNQHSFVTICSTTTPEVIYAFYAISKIGAIANVMSPFYTPEELIARIDECGSKVIIMADRFLPKFRETISADKSKTVIVLPLMNSSLMRFLCKRVRPDRKKNEFGWRSFVKLGRKMKETFIAPYESGAPLAMVYSSGTTGASKGILLSVDSFQRLINAYGNSGFDTSRGQAVFQNIPPWHSTGLSLGINFPLSYGVKVCTDPRFDHDVFIKRVLKYQPDYILTNTTMFQGFTCEKSLKRMKGKSLAFLKYPVEGGEPLTPKDIDSIEHVFRTHGSNARLLNGYGECECGATVTTDITSHKFAGDASGIPLPKITTIGVFDDNCKELRYGQRGNIYVKTDIGMIEYYKNPMATREFFYIDPRGERWSKTGDIGYINVDGSLVVLGRGSDYIVIKGKKYYNFDVESAILKSDKVKLCEIQAHPIHKDKLVAHIVWENEAKRYLDVHPEKKKKVLLDIQELVITALKDSNPVPEYFCEWNTFPSAHSGKRDIRAIRERVNGVYEIG